MAKLNPLQINIMKYGTVNYLLNGYLKESINFVYIPYIYHEWLMFNFIIKLTIDILHTFYIQYFCGPTLFICEELF